MIPDNFDTAVQRIVEVVLREGEVGVDFVPPEFHGVLRKAIIKGIKSQVGGTVTTRSYGNFVWASSNLVHDARTDEENRQRQRAVADMMDRYLSDPEADTEPPTWRIRWLDALAV